jgi:hypothetical protein
MIYPRLQNRGRLVCTLLATTLLLPALAFADHDNGKGNKGEKDDKGDTRQGKRPWGQGHSGGSGSKRGLGIGSFFWCGPVVFFATLFEYQTQLENNGNPVHAPTRLIAAGASPRCFRAGGSPRAPYNRAGNPTGDLTFLKAISPASH